MRRKVEKLIKEYEEKYNVRVRLDKNQFRYDTDERWQVVYLNSWGLLISANTLEQLADKLRCMLKK